MLFLVVKYFFKPFIIEHLIERIVSAIAALEVAIRAAKCAICQLKKLAKEPQWE